VKQGASIDVIHQVASISRNSRRRLACSGRLVWLSLPSRWWMSAQAALLLEMIQG